MSATATLAGIPLAAAQRFAWELTPGVRPVQRTFESTNDVVDALLAQRGKPVSLVIDAPGWPALTVDGLYILDALPGSTPFTKAILVSDVRYQWARKVVVRDYNLRRRTGETRMVGEGRLENRELVADVAYAPWSLDGGQKWSPERCLMDVLAALGVSAVVHTMARKIEVENLTLNDPGDQALQAVLGYFAGLDVTVDADGSVRVIDTRDGSEGGIVASAGPPIVGTGYAGASDKSYSRPSKVTVLFEREVELRFDFTEGEDLSTVARGNEPRKLQNVIPSPDAAPLSVAGRSITQGTYLDINEWFGAIGTSGQGKTLDQIAMRKFYMANWSYSSDLYELDGNGAVDPVWVKRRNAARSHWRKTFRILRQWKDKIRSMRAYRALLIDPETGTRAPAEAFMDYLTVPSDRGLSKKTSQNTDIGRQVAGYPTSGKLADGKSAPVDITIKDEDAGVFRVYLVGDPWGESDDVVPGNVETLPSYDPSKKDASGKLAILAYFAASPLKDNFKMAAVFTCVQACPNNSGRYHKVVVSPSEAGGVLGVSVGACNGPEATVIVGGGTQTARFGWSDDFSGQIEQAFYAGGEFPASLLSNANEIRAIAKAEAARVYAGMLDRVEGAFSVGINPAARVTGAITSVEHSIEMDGSALTTIAIAPEMEPIDGMAFIPASAQKIIRRMVQP